jgi:hypothetical protein
MRQRLAIAMVCLLVLAFALPALASAEEAGSSFPYGRWEGSAIGEGLDREGKPKVPIAVKVWLSDNGDGTVKMTVSTPAVPFSFDAQPATAQKVSGGWDVPVTVSYGSGKRSIRGSGTLRLRQRTDGWYAWGSGSGSALGSQEGSGHGSARRVTETSSLVDQFLGPIKDTFESFGDSEAVAVPTNYPEGEFEAAPVETSASDVAAGGDSYPNEAADVIIIICILILLTIFDIAIGE